MPFDQRFEVLRDKEDIHQNTFTVISYFCKTLGSIYIPVSGGNNFCLTNYNVKDCCDHCVTFIGLWPN